MSSPTLIAKPARIQAAGNKPKLIDEFVGRVNSSTSELSIAKMQSPGGWQEPGQTPEFDEFTVVVRGMLQVEYRGGVLEVRAGQAVICPRGQWIDTVRQSRKARSTLRFAHPRFRRTPSTETLSESPVRDDIVAKADISAALPRPKGA